MQEILLETRYFERGLSKSLKVFFWTQSLLMTKLSKKRPGTSDQLLFRLQNKSRKIPLLVIYYLTKFDDIIQRGFWVIPKITSVNLCGPIHDMINYSFSICPFWSGKCGKEGEKLWKFEHFESEKSFLDKIKNILNSFWRGTNWLKNLIKNRGHKL